jgi:hypothetical protein
MGAWITEKFTKDSAAPALRWAAEFSQRENCHQNCFKIRFGQMRNFIYKRRCCGSQSRAP